MSTKQDQKGKLTKIEELKETIANLEKERDNWKNKYLRALADYQNLEKRIIQEKEEIVKKANFELIKKMLTILDDLEKAELFIKDKGLKMIKDSFLKILQSENVEEIEVLGKPFDPYTCEAVEILPGKEDNKVLEVVRKGYRIGNQIIRVAQVKVGKKNN